jgi:hypothetical protein
MSQKDRVTVNGIEVTRYKFRAEIGIDALLFFTLVADTQKRAALVNMRINPLHLFGQEENDVNFAMPDAVASFGTTLSKQEILELIEQVPDGHVMEATIAEESEYTGIRRISSDVPFVARTAEPTMEELTMALQRPV